MRIVVLVKQVPEPDTADDPLYAPDLTVNRAALPGRLDEADEYALEQAGRHPGGVIRDDSHGSAAVGLADFLAARHLI